MGLEILNVSGPMLVTVSDTRQSWPTLKTGGFLRSGAECSAGRRGEDMKDRLLTLREAATLLRCSERTARRMADDGDIQALKIRGSLRVTRESVEHVISEAILEFQIKNGIGPDYV